MNDKIHPIINKPHEYEVIFFSLKKDTEAHESTYIELHLKKNSEIKKLQFIQPVDLEIEKGFYGNICGMEILDIKDHQLDNIGVQVRNFEQDAGITFMAKEVVEVNE